MALLEQVASVDQRFRRLRLKRTEAFIERNAAFIRRLQGEGRADPALDPQLAAMALSATTAGYSSAIGGRSACPAPDWRRPSSTIPM